MRWLKQFFHGQPDHHDPRVNVDGRDLDAMTLAETDLAGIELGRQIDAIRERRRALRLRADALRLAGEQ